MVMRKKYDLPNKLCQPFRVSPQMGVLLGPSEVLF
jgi:hypothetical protein